MKNSIKVHIIFALLLTAFACGGGGDDSGSNITPPTEPPVNTAPTAVQLTFPTSDLLCIDNNIAFSWTTATDPDGDSVSYLVTVATDRNLTNVIEQQTVFGTIVDLTLEKSVAYYWNVTSKDNNGNETKSATYAFYTEGEGVSNYAPFTAAVVSPEYDATVNAGNLSLSWSGGDTNVDDVLTYEIFFGESADPPLVLSDLSAENTEVTVASGKTYYWKINTSDDSGAKSIGQIWKFNVN